MNNIDVRIYEDKTYQSYNNDKTYVYFYRVDSVLYGQRFKGRISGPQQDDLWQVELANDTDYINQINQIITDKFEFIKESTMNFNCYYPRINWNEYMYNYRDEKQAIQFFEAGRMLMDKLHKITYTINPNILNDCTYGHETRSLLLLICMEVENNFISILKENGYIKDRYSTQDFIKLNEVLDLNEFEVVFELFTEYPPIKPFEEWDENRPTQSLWWYDAYNKTKHSREDAFDKGNFKSVLYSMAGLITLLYSQFHMFPYDNLLFKIHGVKVKFPIKKPEKIYLRHPRGTGELEKKEFFS